MTQAIDLGNNPFEHRKNIQIGQGRIVWRKACSVYTEGWVLPGGEITINYDKASRAAFEIDQIARAAKQR